MIVMSVHYLLEDQSGILRKKDVASSLWYIVVFRAHVLFGLIAITFGPFQFISRIRERGKFTHMLLGYSYFVSVFISGLSGIVVAPFAMGGWITSLGFTLLAGIWLFITAKSVFAVSNKDFNNHMRWSYLSYSITFSAITQRTLLLIPLLTSVPFLPIYQLSAWLPWILNLLIAYLIFKRYSIKPGNSENVHTLRSNEFK